MSQTQEIKAVKLGCQFAFVLLLLTALIGFGLVFDSVDYDAKIEQAKVQGYQQGYEAGSRDCIQAYLHSFEGN